MAGASHLLSGYIVNQGFGLYAIELWSASYPLLNDKRNKGHNGSG
jgi:hypothetical protein